MNDVRGRKQRGAVLRAGAEAKEMMLAPLFDMPPTDTKEPSAASP